MLLDVVGVDDEPRGEREHLARQREVLGLASERRQPLVEDAVGEQAADDAVRPLHRVEVAVPVSLADGHARDQVEDEVMEHDEAGVRRRASRIQPCASGLLPMW